MIVLELTEYPAALFEFMTRATLKPTAELAAEITSFDPFPLHQELESGSLFRYEMRLKPGW
jgi:hypothetical protein